jgi:N-acetylmuramoyl-L-alanine amidase
MTEEQTKSAVSTIRWHVLNQWGQEEGKAAILDICGNILGYPPSGSEPTAPGSAPLSFGPVRIAIVVGHNSKAPGAEAPNPIGMSEFDFNNRVADEMVRLCPPELTLSKFNRFPSTSYNREIADVYAKVNAWKADASIELHFNSASPSATGTETLTGAGSESKKLGAFIQQAMLASLGLRDRGAKVLTADDRGYRSIIAGSAPALLTEPFFASNSGDLAAAAKLGPTGFARMYLSGLVAYAKSKRS